MQIQLTLLAKDSSYSAKDLGFLLHKHPDHVHVRSTPVGEATVFYPEVTDVRTTAVLHLSVDPIGLVRGKNQHSDGLLAQYVNDRPYVANSFLSVALTRSFAQSMSGKSKSRQELADQPLPFEIVIVPLSISAESALPSELFAPLGYNIDAVINDETGLVSELRLSGTLRLADILNHLYVLIPVIDNFKHYFVAEEEVDKLLAKGEGWLASHPAKELIARRALKNRRSLANIALARLQEGANIDPLAEEKPKQQREEQLEKPLKLHDLRLDTVADVLRARGVSSVLDLGCGEGKLISRLIKERGLNRIVGVDPSVRVLEYAHQRLHMDRAGDALLERVSLQMGSLTYGDRRWKGFDAATLVEVIEHIEPHRLSALVTSLFADAMPRLVVMTTPNREYNALFENMGSNQLRHPDHRFEWTREEFSNWANGVADEHKYSVSISPLGESHPTLGAPSQMAVFEQATAVAQTDNASDQRQDA